MKNTTTDVRALIAEGFLTKAAKQEAKGILNSTWRILTQRVPLSTRWGLPDYAHQISTKTFQILPRELHDEAQEIRLLAQSLKVAEVLPKAAPKVDDTKVRELSPAEATTAGIDFIDMKGDRRGYCYICGRIGFMLNRAGSLSRHGYSRPGWGYDVGGCSGTRNTPEETLDVAIAFHSRQIEKLGEHLATDLVAFAITQARLQVKAQRAKYGTRRGGHGRVSQASAFRALRNNGSLDVQTLTSPNTWRRMLGQQLAQHRADLANLEAVKAGI